MKPRISSDDGYTLLEMLVVCAILALAAGAAAGLARPRGEGVKLEAAAREMAARLRFARSSAIARNTDIRFMFDLARGEYGIEGQEAVKLPEGTSVALTLANPERQGPNIGTIRFLPGGEASGGSVSLQLGKFHSGVEVDWMTGSARVTP